MDLVLGSSPSYFQNVDDRGKFSGVLGIYIRQNKPEVSEVRDVQSQARGLFVNRTDR